KNNEVIAKQEDILFHAQISKDLENDFKNITVTDDDVKKYYDENKEYRSAHILFRLRAEPTPEEVKTGLTLGLDKPPLPPATTTMTTVSAVLEFGEKVKEWTSVMETYKLEVEEEQAKQDITPVSVQGEVDELRAKLYVLETENGELRESVDSANSKAEFLATAIKALAELVFSMATSNTSDSRAILENTRQTLTRVFGSSAAEDSE
ncbi:MAG: hypothetical protein EBS86_12010, partial [Crocinitomicaceae bacterium]|nr:hypothetical protein [Crocinitomicaceae bacterium]